MFGDRIARSIAIAKESYAVLKSNPCLGLFPVISGIFTLIASIPFVAALVLTSIGHHHKEAFGPLHYGVTFGMYMVNMFIVIFFNSALVACANESLQGRPTTMAFGIRTAASRLPQILTWAFIASTVGMVLRMVSERAGAVGSIVSAIFGLAWNLIVFFVVPILVLEKVSPIEAIKTSGAMLKRTWGERIVLGVGISTVMALLALVVLLPIGLGIFFIVQGAYPVGIFCFVGAVVYGLTLAVAGSALGTIYQTALYLYCRDGIIPAGFQPASMQNAFRAKPERKFFGR